MTVSSLPADFLLGRTLFARQLAQRGTNETPGRHHCQSSLSKAYKIGSRSSKFFTISGRQSSASQRRHRPPTKGEPQEAASIDTSRSASAPAHRGLRYRASNRFERSRTARSTKAKTVATKPVFRDAF